MLVLDSVTSQYEEKVIVLRGISMSAEKGLTTCILGSNGAGKTTIVKSIVNLIRPKEGRITFSDVRIEKMKTHQIIKLGISVVPEGRQLFPKLTVAESLRLGAYFENDQKVIRTRMAKTFEIFPILKERIEQVSGTLSGGELGILSIARSLMAEPKMIILDEPSLGLAPLMTSRVFNAIKNINERGITILLIEQNAKKSLQISSYGYILQKGEIIGEGDVESLKESETVKKAYLRG
jgi:branched-chain amino acid transport system ATP-binding protein